MPAIFMTTVLSHVRAATRGSVDPGKVVSEVNRFVAQRSADDMFASLWLGIFDQAQGTLDYVDAGHGHWLLKRAGSAPELPTRPQSLLIGIDAQSPYESLSITLQPGTEPLQCSSKSATVGKPWSSQVSVDPHDLNTWNVS